jgi:hypothetical protein
VRHEVPCSVAEQVRGVRALTHRAKPPSYAARLPYGAGASKSLPSHAVADELGEKTRLPSSIPVDPVPFGGRFVSFGRE